MKEERKMKDGQRFAYLDLIKIVAMMCVCLYHYPLIWQTAYARPFTADVLVLRYFRVFDAICVPLFMMVNGALILNRPFQLKKHMVLEKLTKQPMNILKKWLMQLKKMV